MATVYVLKCEQNKYYVGKTLQPLQRVVDHFANRDCEWARRYRPQQVVETKRNVDVMEEDQVVVDYMRRFGIGNVRGGSYDTIQLSDLTLKYLEDEMSAAEERAYQAEFQGHFNPLSTIRRNPLYNPGYQETNEEDEEHEWDRFNEDDERCYRCGRYGHYANDCFAKMGIDGRRILN